MFVVNRSKNVLRTMFATTLLFCYCKKNLWCLNDPKVTRTFSKFGRKKATLFIGLSDIFWKYKYFHKYVFSSNNKFWFCQQILSLVLLNHYNYCSDLYSQKNFDSYRILMNVFWCIFTKYQFNLPIAKNKHTRIIKITELLGKMPAIS